jgi:hypothetical protein
VKERDLSSKAEEATDLLLFALIAPTASSSVAVWAPIPELTVTHPRAVGRESIALALLAIGADMIAT